MDQLAISTIDLAIVVVYMLVTVLVGLWLGGRQESIRGYFLANNSLPWWALLFSIVATETSTVTFLSVPGIAYSAENGDLRFLQVAIGFLVGRIVVAYLILPGFFRGTYLTSYELLQEKFGTGIRSISSLLFMITRTLADALRLYLTAIVLREVIQMELWICVVMIGLATMVYTFFGGMKSVVWNDCIQFLVYMLGAMVAFFVLLNLLPSGWQSLTEFAETNNKFRWLDFDPDPRASSYTFWIGLAGGAFLSMATHGTDQITVQRLLSSRTETRAAMALVGSGIVVFFQFALFLLIGIGLACFYQTGDGDFQFTSNDQVFATFIVQNLPKGIVGLILAAVFSAAMSTLSSSLNASSSALVNDFILPNARKDEVSQEKLLVHARWATIGFGLAQILIAIVAERIIGDRSAVYKVLTIAGFTTGPILGLFFLAMAGTRIVPMAAVTGFVGGLAVLSILAFVIPEDFRINGFYYCLVGSVSTFCIARGTHFLTNLKKNRND